MVGKDSDKQKVTKEIVDKDSDKKKITKENNTEQLRTSIKGKYP